MNRIIIIGNGFDKAHNLRTGYIDFIDDYWSNFTNEIRDIIGEQYGMDTMIRPYSDSCVSLEKKTKSDVMQNKSLFYCEKENPYNELLSYIEEYNKVFSQKHVSLNFKNKFFEYISNQCSLTSWLDIENEYYDALKRLLLEESSIKRNEKIIELNKEFESIQDLLEKHLVNVTENVEIEKHQSIQEAFSSVIEFDDIATCKQTEFVDSIFSDMYRFDNLMNFEQDKETDPQYNICSTVDEERMYFVEKKLKNQNFKEEYCMPYTLILNFNYTKTAERLYTNEEMNYKVINIHGELQNQNNQIIFGYGDELDDDYQKIEKLQDNDFLENIKSIKYHKTRNYRDLLEFIKSGIYQVFVMGHSCGNSDRTLLNTLFEHNNCASVKVYYRQYPDGSDDYSNLIRNISRNFNNKPQMRDIVVNWENCSPLVPYKKYN
ncbi:hypothetical protein IR148_03825 [Dysgonomonas mossii]|uniref:Bacteriophage abortive infection AbiH n=1 Tax=Dysgonomonas mossii TaxID=163665 RepID=A0A4Y9ITL5_9BACT|nr:AbiH family protein [Dysgonomonas mossii]MBF0760170.1 hypothetical protein [Dysgonomonas mossii]TFU91119.1 hypothetical protein E4T88_03820 [Dysgonomonas mossii]